jgi:hypothetical protein
MRDDPRVRTTLDLDEDILQAAKELAVVRGMTAGQVVSELARKGLTPATAAEPRVRNGVPLLPRQPAGSPRLGPMTMKLVNALRDDA